jgi:predicted small secreted protein
MKKTNNLILGLLMAGILVTGCGVSETQEMTNSS